MSGPFIMPFPYTASARNRRLKEREPRSVRTSSSSRRPRDVSRVSDNRSPAPNLQAPHSPLYIQENTTLEQLPPLPSSGTASPSSAASPILQSSKLLPNSAGVYHLTTTPHTPACLRKYLESEPELDTSDFPLAVQEHEETSLAIRDQTDWRQSPAPLPTSDSKPRSLSPILRESGEAATNHSASPPPATILTAEAQLLPSSPKFYSPTPVAPRGPYLTSPHSITPAVPWQEHYSNEYLYSSTYPGPQYYGMVQPNGTAAEGQPYPIHPMPYFTDQGSPHPVPVPYDPTRTLQYQDFSTATGQGNLPYALPTTHYAHVETGGQVRPEGSLSGNQPPEDDTVDLLYRVQNAIPDLHLLLNRYKETSGQLGQQEDLIRQSEAQKAKALRQKEAYIERLVKELEMQSQKYSTESSKLHVEIGNLEEMHRELQDSMVAKTRSNDELEAANQTLQRQNAILEQQAQQALDAANKDLKQVVGEFNDKELSIREDLWSKTRAEEALRAKVLEMSRAHIDEREHLKASWTRERQDIEKSHFGVRLELEKALEACHLDLEKSKGKEQEGRDRWEEDRKGLIQTWDAERLKIGTISEQRYKALEAQHAWEKMDIQSKLKSSRKEPLKRVEEENLELKIEIEKLKIGWDADKKKFERASSELTALADKANRENINLQKMVESFGDVTEFRSHGDPFYVDAFNQLRKQILELVTQHCKGSLGKLPESLLDDIPAEIPDFSSDTTASIQLRAAYIQHIVSRILTQRIFRPFLFTLTRRHLEADELLQTMSKSLRHDSWRREASWRQQTLNAAYTVSTAKQSTNRIAAVIIEEIMDYIQYLTPIEEREQIKVAIRRIVKMGAETWRYARLEREWITASMPLTRKPLKADPKVTDGPLSPMRDSDITGAHVILPLLPVIRREARHQELGLDPYTEHRGCTYLEGEALCSNSSMVVARLSEIEPSRQIPAEPVADHQIIPPQSLGVTELPLATQSPVAVLESASLGMQDVRTHSDGLHVSEPNPNIPSRSRSTREAREMMSRRGTADGVGGKDAAEAKEMRGTRRRASISRASLHGSSDRRRSSMILPPEDGPTPDWSNASGVRRLGR